MYTSICLIFVAEQMKSGKSKILLTHYFKYISIILYALKIERSVSEQDRLCARGNNSNNKNKTKYNIYTRSNERK